MEEGEEEGGWNNLVRVLPGGALHEIYGEFAGLVVDGYPIVSATGDSIEQQHLACLWAAESESGGWREGESAGTRRYVDQNHGLFDGRVTARTAGECSCPHLSGWRVECEGGGLESHRRAASMAASSLTRDARAMMYSTRFFSDSPSSSWS